MEMRPQTDIHTDNQTDMARLGEKIRSLLASNPTMTIPVMSRELSVTTRTIERELKKLRAAGKIAREGGKRFGHWIVK